MHILFFVVVSRFQCFVYRTCILCHPPIGPYVIRHGRRKKNSSSRLSLSCRASWLALYWFPHPDACPLSLARPHPRLNPHPPRRPPINVLAPEIKKCSHREKMKLVPSDQVENEKRGGGRLQGAASTPGGGRLARSVSSLIHSPHNIIFRNSKKTTVRPRSLAETGARNSRVFNSPLPPISSIVYTLYHRQSHWRRSN